VETATAPGPAGPLRHVRDGRPGADAGELHGATPQPDPVRERAAPGDGRSRRAECSRRQAMKVEPHHRSLCRLAFPNDLTYARGCVEKFLCNQQVAISDAQKA
jgi:hypothetical protein